MATARHRRRWASTARLWPRGSSSAARSTQREQISALGVVDVSFRMQLSMEETTPASPSTGMGSSARSCARSRLPSSGATVDLTVAAMPHFSYENLNLVAGFLGTSKRPPLCALGTGIGRATVADPISGSRAHSGALALWAEKRPTPQSRAAARQRWHGRQARRTRSRTP